MHILAEAKIGLKTSGRKIFMGEICVDFTECKTVNTEMQQNREAELCECCSSFLKKCWTHCTDSEEAPGPWCKSQILAGPAREEETDDERECFLWQQN